MEKVLIALSGGIDSSVAALLLKEQGFDVVGATMSLLPEHFYKNDPPSDTNCCSLNSILDAKKVCWKLGIKHHVFNFRDLFEQKVIKPFYAEYKNGRTPNPCVLCNSQLKWEALLLKADLLGCRFFATGHYAKIKKNPNENLSLLKGKDEEKDQSYFLWSVKESALARTLFPLGDFLKKEVKLIAKKENLPVAQKKESQETCFVPDSNYERFFKDYATKVGDSLSEGDIVDGSGKIVGQHSGLLLYTIGQRKGIGHHESMRKYVVDIDAAHNRIVIGGNQNLFQSDFIADQLNWIGFSPDEKEEWELSIKIRYRQKDKKGILRISSQKAFVHFHEAQRAITPGQSAVFYMEDRVLGGGIIRSLGKK